MRSLKLKLFFAPAHVIIFEGVLDETNKKILNEDYDKMLDRLHEIFNILYPSAN